MHKHFKPGLHLAFFWAHPKHSPIVTRVLHDSPPVVNDPGAEAVQEAPIRIISFLIKILF
jgi:hypothetical protein